jgi:hypothetical protein
MRTIAAGQLAPERNSRRGNSRACFPFPPSRRVQQPRTSGSCPVGMRSLDSTQHGESPSCGRVVVLPGRLHVSHEASALEFHWPRAILNLLAKRTATAEGHLLQFSFLGRGSVRGKCPSLFAHACAYRGRGDRYSSERRGRGHHERLGAGSCSVCRGRRAHAARFAHRHRCRGQTVRGSFRLSEGNPTVSE